MAWRWRWQRLALMGGIALAITIRGATAVGAVGTHTVRPGETLDAIAAAYGISPAALAAVNDLADENRIYAGEQLALPGSAPSAPRSATAAAPSSIYYVQAGDTLSEIAVVLGTTPRQLLALNPQVANPDLLFAGQVLRVPDTRVRAATAAPLPARGDVAALLADYAIQYGLDPALVQALAWQESGWQQGVVSRSGAVGVMQILPETGVWLATDLVGEPLDIAGSTDDNILAGVAYLRWLVRQTGGERQALIAYVQGQRSVARDGVYPETERYVANIMALRAHIARYGASPPP